MPPLPNRYFRLLTLTLLLALALPTSAGVSESELNAQKELLQLKIDSGKELLQKDIEALGKRFEAVDKRIDDQVSRVSDIGSAVDRFAFISGLLGILITVILTAAGIFGFLFAASRARETASTVATEVATRTATRIAEDKAAEKAKQWIADNNTQLHKEIEEVRKAALHAQEEIDKLRKSARQGQQEVDDSVIGFKAKAEAAMAQIQKNLSATSPDATKPLVPQSDSNTQALNKLAETLKNSPDAENDFEAWNTRAFAAYNAEKLEEAALCWQHAAQTPNASPIQATISLFNAGLTLDHQQRHNEAITIYEQLIARYGEAPSPDIREQVANAMNCIGFNRLLAAKQAWGNAHNAPNPNLLALAKTQLQCALVKKPGWGMALGNLAYVESLLGNAHEAEQHFRAALASSEHGGKQLYNDTLNDITRHPIDEDKTFKEMIERLWAEYQAAQPPST